MDITAFILAMYLVPFMMAFIGWLLGIEWCSFKVVVTPIIALAIHFVISMMYESIERKRGDNDDNDTSK